MTGQSRGRVGTPLDSQPVRAHRYPCASSLACTERGVEADLRR